MSTRGYIAKQIGPDQFRTVFCHFDGYLEHVGAMLAGHYDTEEMVDKLLDLGDIDALYSKLEPEPGSPHGLDGRQPDVTVAYGRDYGDPESEATVKTLQNIEEEAIWVEYAYVFAEDKRWKFFYNGHADEGMRDLKTVLDEMGVDYGPVEPAQKESFDMKM